LINKEIYKATLLSRLGCLADQCELGFHVQRLKCIVMERALKRTDSIEAFYMSGIYSRVRHQTTGDIFGHSSTAMQDVVSDGKKDPEFAFGLSVRFSQGG
jgi:hypothetical protein